MKRTLLVIIILVSCNVCTVRAQTESETSDLLGLMAGTSAMQGMSLSLYDLNRQEIATSSPLTPAQLIAFYQRGVTQHVAVRFLSGYTWGRQIDQVQFDYSKVQLEGDEVHSSESKFFISGFPIEMSVLFHNSIGESGAVSWHCGIGAGHYTYNFEAKGTINVKNVVTLRHSKTEYSNDPYTLSGWAQFFVLGFQVQLNDKMGAICELSKIGFSGLYLEQDVMQDVIVDGEVERKIPYGYTKQQYLPETGLNDVAVSVGIFWKL
ncbi:hypothetical protein JW960_24110 [candidate division KSB1 bacterium]|nr:hypothetical protein [candidate division KSB1 bacterium]